MKKITLFLLLILLGAAPGKAFAQKDDDDDESKWVIEGDTIKVSAKGHPSLKFMGEIQDAQAQSDDYGTPSSGHRVNVRPKVSNPVRFASMYVNEGSQSSPRQHTFIIEYVKELSVEDQTHDYSTKEKLQARMAYLENAKKNPQPKQTPPEDAPEKPERNSGTNNNSSANANTSADNGTAGTTKGGYSSKGATGSKRITSEGSIRDIPREKLEERVNQKVNAFYSACKELLARRDIAASVKYGMGLFNNEESVLVERTNKKTGKHQTTKIRSYFNSLTQLPYAKVEMTAKEINFVSKFVKGLDGKWHGSAVILQDFKAFNDNTIAYADQTTKAIDIIIEVNEVIKDGKVVEVFDVFLGNISVNDTNK